MFSDQQASFILSATLAQSERLATALSSAAENEIERLREVWREGARHEASDWIKSIKSDPEVWQALATNVRAKILIFEAFLVLDESGDLVQAKLLADEARSLGPFEDQSRLLALITHRESGPRAALDILIGKDDPDSLNLRAAFLLEQGALSEGRSLLDAAIGSKPNAETYRISALSYLLLKDMARARLEVKKAIEIAPKWKGVRTAAGVINYLSALSPAAIPSRIARWAEPVDWSFVKRDDESLSRLREAEQSFRQLIKEAGDDDDEERRDFEAWRLSCFANDPDRQEEATKFCREILSRDRTHYRVISWALARKYDVKLGPSEKRLKRLVDSNEAEIPHILALVGIYLASGPRRAPKAIGLLKNTEPVFKKQKVDALWIFWFCQSLIINRNPSAALRAVAGCEPSPATLNATALALRGIALETQDFQPLLDHLERSYSETNDPVFLLEACDLMAYRHEWPYVADRAEELVSKVQTPDALRLAAISAHNANRFHLCLRLLDNNRGLLRGGKLPSELRRIRVGSCQAIGIIPEAVAEAESLARDEPTTEHLIDLARLYSTKGDLKSLAILARRILDRPNLKQEELIRLAYLVHWEDQELAIALWRQAMQLDIPDELVAVAVDLGFQLGLDVELGPLLARMRLLAMEGKGGIQIATIEDLISLESQRREQSGKLSEFYRNGTGPVHLIAGQLNQPLVYLYHFLAGKNEGSPDPVRQFPLFIRHGGRQLMGGLPVVTGKLRICMDITAVLLAMHLEILRQVEESFRPIAIPAEMVPALIHMREQVSHHQPKRLEACQQIVELVGNTLMGALEFVPAVENHSLIEELGPEWVGLFEYARSQKGHLVDFYPIRKRGISGEPASIPESLKKYVTSCRALIESLRSSGPLSDKEYEEALEALGDQGQVDISDGDVPRQGSLLILRANVPEILADANLLRTICSRFKVILEKKELEAANGELEGARQRASLFGWLSTLTDRISQGIGDGTYEVLPKQADTKLASEELGEISAPAFDCLRSLLQFSPMDGDIIWCDDRSINGYLRRDAIPIIGISEMLMELLRKEIIKPEYYYEQILKLRAANARFIPVEKDEILHHLGNAVMRDGRVVETRALNVLRRYVAACLHDGNMLQRPPMPKGSPNETGELAYALGLLSAVSDSVIEVWKKQEDDEDACRAKADWLIDNLYFDHIGAFRAVGIQKTQEEENYIAAVGLAGLVAHAIGLSSLRKSGKTSARRNYFEWLFDRILKRRFVADPDLIFGVAESLKSLIRGTKESVEKTGSRSMAAKALQLYYEDLPSVIKDELVKDSDFVAGMGMKLIDINQLGELKFDADDFWRAVAETVNGQTVSLNTIDTKLPIMFHRKRPANSILPEFSTDGMIVFGWSNAMAPVL
jgi:tetratricopeptide (TPR) repeat protein